MPFPRVAPVRRVPADQGGDDYASAFTAPVDGLTPQSPEGWARATFEGAPIAVQRLLRIAWRGGLWLQLGPRSSSHHVLGWAVTGTGPDGVTLEARSPMLTAHNTVSVDGSTLTWTTTVRFENPAGRVLWAAAAPLHHRVIPLLLRRAVRGTG